ncbi:MAG: DNA polymerase III subunit alpha, partial [Chitinophagaceae bacterium]|nr:DNA polymerase III subunit alpha [Chitinophagaceae bacterium]
MKFSHLHNHTQYSLLDGASDIDKLFKKAAADNMPGMAITDHGNMFGVYDFVKASKKYVDDKGVPLVKPIIGCEFYMTEDRFQTKFSKENKDKRHHQLLLAKNHEGYKNLIKLCSIGFTEGLYSKWPRIDKTVLKEYSKGLIATTCCLGAIVPKTILQKGEDAAEKEFLWWKDVFGEDYYVELQRHGIPDQDICNEVLVRFAHKYNVKIIASNDSHYVEEEDSYSQDILLCINTGSLKSVPIKDDFSDNSEESRNTRFGFSLNEFYFKDTNQMAKIFKDLPQALDNTNEIVDKIELINITNDLLLPNFPTPPEFKDQFDYLSFLTHQGAKGRYLITTPEIESRIEFELGVIKKMGFPGYFLIVSDIIHWAKQNNVFVGTGRGSAAGSVVAYCIGITNIDPMKHNLLFERFLNPDRKSMPDIDTDFDDTGRGKVIQYIVDTYGKEQVAHIITHNKMAAKMSVKDVARVLELPLAESNELAKLIPELPGTSLRESLHLTSDEMAEKYKDKVQFQENIKELQNRYKGNDLAAKVLKEAEKLEGTIRNTGLHAAGIIIGPEPLTNIMPVCKHKDSELYMTQFEGKIIEEVGAIKIDILGLTNLTILRDSIEMVKENHGVEVDLETLPLTDEKTFLLYQKAETEGTFQFASDGMKAHLVNLKPDNIEDLIALNALFRPGPMEYIDDFIKRKFGIKQIEYDLPEMEEYLKETYGITVYQEQVMLLSQKLANFSRGDADKLRKAMGKKDKKTLDEMKEQFTDGCVANGHAKSKIEKIWKDWEAFAQYAFNKSHSTCYAYLAYQTAYFKANYPAEYMTALLNANRTNIDSISKYMRECRQMGLQVLGPDIKESLSNFSVKKDGIIRFGMAGVKGVGEA